MPPVGHPERHYGRRDDKAVLEFFETVGRNFLGAETAAVVRHHVALSIVGIDRTDNG